MKHDFALFCPRCGRSRGASGPDHSKCSRVTQELHRHDKRHRNIKKLRPSSENFMVELIRRSEDQ